MGKYNCTTCNDTGWYSYDDNHSKVCEVCCTHDEGWWELTEGFAGYKEGEDNRCCLKGCGTLRRNLNSGG